MPEREHDTLRPADVRAALSVAGALGVGEPEAEREAPPGVETAGHPPQVGRGDAAGRRWVGVLPHNLPPAMLEEPFVGRRDDLGRLLELLGTGRLTTITGMGGVGKSRLAVEVARRIAREEGDALDPLREKLWEGILYLRFDRDAEGHPPQVGRGDAAAIWSALWEVVSAEREVRGPRMLRLFLNRERAVTDHLRGEASLLLLDSCEHLDQQALAGVVRALYETCLRLHILLTSRRRVGQSGEQVLHLGPLVAADAADLFTRQAAASGSRLDAADTRAERAVASICRRLDRVPLAIVLAAARLPHYGHPTALLADLERSRLAVLRPETAVTDARQRTMEACLRWSYDRLSAEARALFGQLLVFHGGWTLAAAQAVCGADPGHHRELVDAHLVSSGPGEGGARFHFPELVREFAAETAGGDRSGLAFRRYMLEWLSAELAGAGWPASLTDEREYVLAALASYRETVPEGPGEIGRLRRLVAALEATLPEPDDHRFPVLYPVAIAVEPLVGRLGHSLDPRGTLATLHRALAVLKVLTGEYRLTALFGDANPDYDALREMERGDWQRQAACTIAALGLLPEEQQPAADLLFAGLYFLSFDWWDAYLGGRKRIARRLLGLWETHRGRDDPMLAGLRRFDQAYPAARLWSDRHGLTREWQQVEAALADVRERLRHSGETQAERYCRGSVARLLGEARFNLAGEANAAPAEPTWEALYLESQQEFEKDPDTLFLFNWQWTSSDLAACYAERDEQDRGARGRALELNRQSLESELEEAGPAGENLDLELLSQIYRVEADVRFVAGEADAAWAHMNAAAFLAYVFLLTEQDDYAIAFYEEATGRVTRRLEEAAGDRTSGGPLPAPLLAACRITRGFWEPYWRPERLPQIRSLTTLSRGGPAALVAVLLPPVPTLALIEPESDEATTPYLDKIRAVVRGVAAAGTRRRRGSGGPRPNRVPEIAARLATAYGGDPDGA